VAELAGTLAEALGRGDLGFEITDEYRAGDIRHCFADTSLAGELLGFRARRSLAGGLPKLAGWVARQTVRHRGDEALADLRHAGLVR
jgi:dTDP-L-rhamnose 4-epimerase